MYLRLVYLKCCLQAPYREIYYDIGFLILTCKKYPSQVRHNKLNGACVPISALKIQKRNIFRHDLWHPKMRLLNTLVWSTWIEYKNPQNYNFTKYKYFLNILYYNYFHYHLDCYLFLMTQIELE